MKKKEYRIWKLQFLQELRNEIQTTKEILIQLTRLIEKRTRDESNNPFRKG